MILDLLDYFKDNPLSEKLVLDSHEMKNGLYIKITENGIKDYIVINKNNKNDSSDKFGWFRERDYYSNVASTNKCFDAPKKFVHNNNYLTIFIRCKSLVPKNLKISFLDYYKDNEVKVLSDLTDSINYFYKCLISKFENKEFKDILDFQCIDRVEQHKVDVIKNYITGFVQEYLKLAVTNELLESDYIKIFYDADLDIYANEYRRYFYPYIFNSNSFNIKIDNKLYGLSNANMGENSKKPFLMHLTTNYTAPFRITSQQALDAKKLLEWLNNQKRTDKGKLINVQKGVLNLKTQLNNFNLSDVKPKSEGHLIDIGRGIETIVENYDFLPKISEQIDKITIENYLELRFFTTEELDTRSKLHWAINKYLFNGMLDKDISKVYERNRLKDLITISKKAMDDFFYSCNDLSLVSILDNLSMALVLEKLPSDNNYAGKTGKALNMRFSLLKYFKIRGKEDMGDKARELYTRLSEIKDSRDFVSCESDEMFFYAVGQLTSYLLSQSQAQKLDYGVVDNLLNAKNHEKIKNELINLHTKYSHSLTINNIRYNNITSIVMGYLPETSKIRKDFLLAGLASKNVLYEKKEESLNEEK